MSEFETISTITKLVTAVFTLYFCMYETKANGNGKGGQLFDEKVNSFFKLEPCPFPSCMDCFLAKLLCNEI